MKLFEEQIQTIGFVLQWQCKGILGSLIFLSHMKINLQYFCRVVEVKNANFHSNVSFSLLYHQD